ncbi:Pre-mRNA-processing factor 17 [Nymphon striatum]|nr:Pre-mRNA-processing factor 17 [Nymphon striatum]
MAALEALSNYSSDDESNNFEEELTTANIPVSKNVISTSLNIMKSVGLNAAPEIITKDDVQLTVPISANTKELTHNPKFEQLFCPVVGPANPFKTAQQKAAKNMLSGYVEPANVNEFHFESQRRTFGSYGYALDPTVDGSVEEGKKLVGASETAEENNALTVFEASKKRPGDRRKRERNGDAADIDGFLGPWGKYVDEETISKPAEEDKEFLEEYIAKKKKLGKQTDDKPMEEKTILHIKDTHDYQGRSFLHIPADLGINLKSDEPPNKCFIPKKHIHTWAGHSKGISAIRWFPQSAHLLLSSSMDSKIKIWEVYNERRCIRTYVGHRQAVRDVCFNNSGDQFLSAGYDRYLKLWDTEKGTCISKFTSRKVPYCVKFHPDEDKQHLFIAGTSDKKIVCWDIRTGEVVQEYDRHLGAVNTITFVDENRRFVSTSDDKSMRVWEWDIPVDMKYIAEPSMHSMPAVTLSPNGKWLACQSMDNKVMIFSALNRFKLNRKKTFTGHMVAGYACAVDFSPEMSYLVSGDADGKVYVWDWKTTKIFSKWKAHDNVCIGVLWHPHETSKLATAGWDGVIKYWD